jgi:hypothetical protein
MIWESREGGDNGIGSEGSLVGGTVVVVMEENRREEVKRF